MSSVTEKLGEIISGVAVAELDNYVELRHSGRHVMAHLNQQNARSGEMGDYFAEIWARDRFKKGILECSSAVAQAVIVSMVAEQKGWVGPLGMRNPVDIIRKFFQGNGEVSSWRHRRCWGK